MLKLQTLVNIPNPRFSINYTSRVLLLGSCFATSIGQRLEQLMFKSLNNPFGVLYNPASISHSIDLLLKKKKFIEDDLSLCNDLWFSFYHHSSFSSPDKTICLSSINKSLERGSEIIRQADVIFITLGTSWVFRYFKTNQIVSNCHKLPAQEFKREFLETGQAVDLLASVFNDILKIKADTKFVLTISPIRHWKDGAIENLRSKASLILAVKELEKLFPQVCYFPVYEIFMDELRDYRFYASDMLHPSEFAIDYVWEKFAQTFFLPATNQQVKEIEKLVSMINHRPMNTNTQAYKKFSDSIKNKVKEIKQKYPEIEISENIDN